jgi:hypothetical protein
MKKSKVLEKKSNEEKGTRERHPKAKGVDVENDRGR